MERLHISYAEAVATPWEEVDRAFYIWSLDSDRAILEEKKGRAR